MSELMKVVLVNLRPLNTADGDQWELRVRDPETGAEGMLVLPEDDFRAWLGDGLASNGIDVDRTAITWKRGEVSG